MKKYDCSKWTEIRAYVLLPYGETIDIAAFMGEGVPERFTTLGYLKRWQRNISRDKERRIALNIKATKEKCHLCGGRIYKTIKPDGKIIRWCGRFPKCEYQKITHTRTVLESYTVEVCPNCGDFLREKTDWKRKKKVLFCDSCLYQTDI